MYGCNSRRLSLDLFPARVWRLAALVTLVMSLWGCKGEKPWTGMWSPGDSVDNIGYRPDQPIPFDHSLHAGKMKMDCQYCHTGARRSAASGVPPTNTCMGCHKLARTEADAIKKVAQSYEAKEAIEWTKVHDLPDFVRFSHKPHLAKFMPLNSADSPAESAEVCAKCHGNVKEMTVAEQVAPLQMGWCIDCHIQNEAKISCNTCHY